MNTGCCKTTLDFVKASKVLHSAPSPASHRAKREHSSSCHNGNYQEAQRPKMFCRSDGDERLQN